MIQRLDTTGHVPTIEYRSELDRYFVVFDDLAVELAPAFTHKVAANEVAFNCYHGVPFFTMIPVVAYGTRFPRPNILMPKVRPVEIVVRIR